MLRVYEVLGWIKEHWPEMVNLILGVFAFVLALRPKAVAELEEKPLWKFGVPIIVGVLAVSGFVLSISNTNNLTRQITTLFAQVNLGATKNDLTTLTSHIDTGFTDVVNAIKNLPQPSKPPKTIAPTKPLATPPENKLPPLPSPAHVSFAQTRGVSTDPEFPYALLVTIQSDEPVAVAFAVVCTGPVGKVDNPFLVGQGAMMSVMFGPSGNEAVVRIGYPQLTPSSPLVVKILSKDDIRAVGIRAL